MVGGVGSYNYLLSPNLQARIWAIPKRKPQKGQQMEDCQAITLHSHKAQVHEPANNCKHRQVHKCSDSNDKGETDSCQRKGRNVFTVGGPESATNGHTMEKERVCACVVTQKRKRVCVCVVTQAGKMERAQVSSHTEGHATGRGTLSCALGGPGDAAQQRSTDLYHIQTGEFGGQGGGQWSQFLTQRVQQPLHPVGGVLRQLRGAGHSVQVVDHVCQDTPILQLQQGGDQQAALQGQCVDPAQEQSLREHISRGGGAAGHGEWRGRTV